MLKFLRKYNKWILVIGGALLMVAFLLPQALTQLGGDPRSATYVRIDGRKINGHRAALAFREYAALDALATGGQGGGALAVAVGIQSPDHWLILSDLAERAGYVGDQRDGELYFADAVRQLFIQTLYMTGRGYMLSDPSIGAIIDATVASAEANRGQIASNQDLTDEQLDLALAKFRGVMRMMEARSAPRRYSRPRLVAEAQQRFDEATVDYVFIDAETRIGQAPEPTNEEIEAHFQAYKDKRPGEGDYGFGYLLPPRVQAEWLVLDQQAIANAIALDEVEVQARLLTHLEQNPEADEDQAYAMVRRQVQGEAVQEVMRLARQAIQLEVDAAQRALPTDGEYFVLPDDYEQTRPSLEQLADAVVRRVEQDPRVRIQMPRPRIERSDDWLTQPELMQLEGIGQAFLPRGAQRVPFPQLAMLVREIAGDGVVGLALQEGVLQARPLQDFSGNQYFFRILAARKESAPDSVDHIRDQVASDLKRLRAYQSLLAERETFLSTAVAEGLEAVAQSASSPEAGPLSEEELPSVESTLVTRARTSPMYLNSEAFRTAVLDAAEKLDPSLPATEADPAARTVAIGIDESLGLAVAQITAWQPLSTERFRSLQRGVAQRVELERSQARELAPFSYEVLLDRLNVEFPDRNARDDDAADETEQDGETA